MNRLECVPNVSEGRRPAIIERLRASLHRPGVACLDVSSDHDHDRTVFTLAGTADDLHAALIALYEEAIDSLDLGQPPPEGERPGVHPKLGAVDVVPFIPLGSTPMSEAIACAERLARTVAKQFDIPVFLYEQAARIPQRQNLANIRRGGFAGLSTKLAEPEWQPDDGPQQPHPSFGATVIGARDFLIAFNVVLAGNDLDLAQRIARRIRASNGGLAAVKALGVRLASRNRVQVSMNLTDFRITSPWQAIERIRQLGADYGVEVVASELVGLIPETACRGGPAEDLALVGGLGPDRILERRLERFDRTMDSEADSEIGV